VHIILDLQACQSPEGRRRGVGRYSLALARAMLANPHGHEMTVLLNASMGDSIEYLRGQFDGLLPQSRIVTWDGLAPVSWIDPSTAFRRSASEVLRREVLRRLKPDVVHVASLFDGFGDDVVSAIHPDDGYLNAVTLYDLIPLAHQETYLADERVRRWYMAKIDHLKRADLLLGISRFSCDEAAELLGIAQERLTNISGAADPMFKPLQYPEHFRHELMSRYGLSRPFVMYAGGFDSRKNIAALVRAFALLPDAVRKGHQLAIVGGAPEPEQKALAAVIASSGLDASEVVFTGYVPDVDLMKLYNLCALYVFPSLQEGFGLPALEAMSSGALVIGSNASSLPEVIGYEEALFDPKDPQAIQAKMLVALTDDGFRSVLREHGQRQPLRFSWQESARRAMSALAAAAERARVSRTGANSAPVQGWRGLTAWLPAPGHEPKPMRHLGDCTVYADDDCDGVQPHRPLSALAAEREHFDRVVIEVSDHAYCAKTLPFAATGMADLVLRDNRLGMLLGALATTPAGRELVISLVYRSGGYPAISAAVASGFSAEVLARVFSPLDLQTLGCAQFLPGEDAAIRADGGNGHWREEARAVIGEIASHERLGSVSEEDWRRIATAVSRDLPIATSAKPQWLVDISTLFVTDAGTGIQRVVRHVLDELIKDAPSGYRVEPICLGEDGIFRYARSYCARRYYAGETLPPDDPVEFAAGDVYLGLDLVAHLLPKYIERFRDLRNRGVQQHYVVYDLLPVLRPDCFDPPSLPLFRSWYEAVAEVADSLMCISKAVADEFKLWLDQARPVRYRPLMIGYFHLGADLGAPHVRQAAAVQGNAQLAALGDRTTFLMVGTVEPRKGHAQTLAAFERLWSQGREVNLLIIGKPGWLMDELLAHMRNHPERGKRLFWYEQAADDLLLGAYARASALIMASEGEGFGLPLIEGAHHGLPLVARDLPVFREIAGEHAHYFSGYDPQSLARSLDQWLALDAQGRAPQSDGMRWMTWSKATRQLVERVRLQHWVHAWLPGGEWRHAAYDYRFRSDVGKLVRGRMHTTGAAGLLLYGLPLALQMGRYVVKIQGGWDGDEGCALLEICSQSVDVLHLRRELCAQDKLATGCLAVVELALGADVSDLDIRIHVDAVSKLWISELRLHPVDQRPPHSEPSPLAESIDERSA